ncbi:ATP-binding protein [uncultured Maricaulis sp.]|uniref:sensor histidine kinase n=1 Tax=uncultured Maricaulis sp. TaxID=174710 RepID=UPI0026162F82|nr:ATP-binding protein [uncultured Maricaulis sp.]
MTFRERALDRFAPVLIGAAGGVLTLVVLRPFFESPRPAFGETVLLGLGALSVAGLCALAVYGLRVNARQRDEADALQRRLEDVELYAKAARHDLREPVRKIITFGERLRERLGPAPDAQIDRCAERMSDAATRMQGMLDELAQYARINDASTDPQGFDAGEEISQLVASAADRLAASGGEVVIGDLPDVHCDRAQFRILFTILLANSIQYAHADRPLRITIDGEKRADGRVEFRCADNGIGFAPDKADRIFQPFERLHTRDAYPGTGIGLATARKIAERHGGTLHAQGEVGNGAVFTLILPLQKASLLQDDPKSRL